MAAHIAAAIRRLFRLGGASRIAGQRCRGSGCRLPIWLAARTSKRASCRQRARPRIRPAWADTKAFVGTTPSGGLHLMETAAAPSGPGHSRSDNHGEPRGQAGAKAFRRAVDIAVRLRPMTATLTICALAHRQMRHSTQAGAAPGNICRGDRQWMPCPPHLARSWASPERGNGSQSSPVTSTATGEAGLNQR